MRRKDQESGRNRRIGGMCTWGLQLENLQIPGSRTADEVLTDMTEAAEEELIPMDDAGGTWTTVVPVITAIRGTNYMQVEMTDGEEIMVVQDRHHVAIGVLTRKKRKESECRKAISSLISCIH